MMAKKPLMLKDYLELDANSDSCGGFVSAPRRADATTVRYLLEAELCGGGSLIRSRSKGALTRIYAVINAVKNLPFSYPTKTRPNQSGSLPRSILKKLKRSFGKKEEEEEYKVRVKDIVRFNSFELYGERRSLYILSPVVSSCSSCSEGGSTGSDFLLSSSGSFECFGENYVAGECGRDASLPKSPNPNSSPSPKRRMGVGEDSKEMAAGHREPKEVGNEKIECRRCQCEEEKEQLSPVSVMDFPYQDDEDEEEEEVDEATSPSPCFEQSLANIERTKHHLLQKIRRFESLAELDPVDLEQRFASFEELLESSDHVPSDGEEEEERGTDEITAWDLLHDLKAKSPVRPQAGTEKLLVDFFTEGLSCSQRWIRNTRTASTDVEELLRTASDWINDGGCREDHGKAQLNELERNGSGWRHFEDGEEEVAADVEVRVLGSLLEELVLDLLPLS